MSAKYLHRMQRYTNNLYFHLLTLLIVAAICLHHHHSRMFNGVDGIRSLLYAQLQWHWMPHKLLQGMNIFEGMGNIFFGFNFIFSPALFIQLLLFGKIGFLKSYVLYSIPCFLTAYLWSHLFELSKRIAITSSWLFVLASLPFLPIAMLRTEFQLIPQIIDLLFFSTLFLFSFRQIGRTNFLSTIGYIALNLIIPLYLSVVFIQWITIVIPIIAISVFYFLLINESRKELLLKILTCLITGILLFALRIPHFLYGIQSYTSFHFFMREMFQSVITLENSSLLFEYKQSYFFSLWVILSLIGATLTLKSENKYTKQLGLLHIILTFCTVSLGIVIYLSSTYLQWRGPQGSYFEMLLWPSYVAYTVYCLYSITLYIVFLFKKFFFIKDRLMIFKKNESAVLQRIYLKSKIKKTFVSTCLNLSLFLIPILAVSFNYSTHPKVVVFPNKLYPITSLYPPKLTPIVAILKSSLALKPGSVFNGYEATFTPAVVAGKGISWFDQCIFDNDLRMTFANDHRLIGLWYYHIPILNEYSQLMTPALYFFSTRLLSRPIDTQFRTVITYTQPNINILRMIGVRFIISNSEYRRSKLMLRKKEFIDSQAGYLSLYELEDPNIGNYSPTKFVLATTANRIMSLLKSGFIDYKKTAIISKPLPKHLVPASNTAMTIEKGGIHIRAFSKKVSALLIPIQYSHCFMPHFYKRGKVFSMQRANLVDTLLIFSGKLNVKLNFAIGPLGYASCRIQDVRDMEIIRLKQSAKKFPLIKTV